MRDSRDWTRASTISIVVVVASHRLLARPNTTLQSHLMVSLFGLCGRKEVGGIVVARTTLLKQHQASLCVCARQASLPTGLLADRPANKPVTATLISIVHVAWIAGLPTDSSYFAASAAGRPLVQRLGAQRLSAINRELARANVWQLGQRFRPS